jgi:hypothetical protein
MKQKINIAILAILIFIVSCDISNNKIATIKNNTSSTIACALLDDEMLTDSSLYADTSYMGYLIPPQHYDTYMVADSNLLKAPDAAKKYIYILKLDSLNKFRKRKIINGILEHSLLKKVKIQLNKVMEPVDTTYAR